MDVKGKCVHVYLCVSEVCIVPPVPSGYVITLDGSQVNALKQRCSPTSHSSSQRPQKVQDGEKTKNVAMTRFFIEAACVHLAKVTSEGAINIAGII